MSPSSSSSGWTFAYWTDVDLHRRPELLLRQRALVSLGHDEYWSASMRRGAEEARDRGINLAFLGANALFRRIRLEPSPLGPDRREVNYKLASEDPFRGNDEEVTANWREPPARRPEGALIGQLYECNPVEADMVISDASAWVFEGTGLGSGDRLRALVGPEYDRVRPEFPTPPNVQVLAHSPVRCGDRQSFSDMTYYTAPSGAGVFATGTNSWVPALGSCCGRGPDPRPDPRILKITENLLEVFAAGPAGVAHPSVSNLAALGIGRPRPAPTGG